MLEFTNFYHHFKPFPHELRSIWATHFSVGVLDHPLFILLSGGSTHSKSTIFWLQSLLYCLLSMKGKEKKEKNYTIIYPISWILVEYSCTWYDVSYNGAPQGSILGPLLFLLNINNLVNVSTKLLPILFADDQNVFISGEDVAETVSTCMTSN